MISALTVVVTNYKRADHLARCLDSLADAGIKRVVVTSACPDEEVLQVIKAAASRFDEYQTVTTETDFGCNETWLRGLYYARTTYVLIMHDDDWVAKSLGAVFNETIYPQLERGVGVASWVGVAVEPDGKQKQIDYLPGPTRVVPSAQLTQVLLKPGAVSLSPTVSIFRREDAIRALREAAIALTPDVCMVRPTMMVGNDMLLYLRALEKHSSWMYVDKPLTFYGAWEGSETIRAFSAEKNWLLPAYEFTQNWFKRVRGPRAPQQRRLIHVYSEYPVTGETERRHQHATKTWRHQYGLGNMLPFPVYDGDLPRSARDIGAPAPIPYIRDLIDYGASAALPGDRVVLTNRDTCLVKGATDRLAAIRSSAVYGPRRDYFSPIPEDQDVLDDLSGGTAHPGADLVSVEPLWWWRWREWIPDLVLGFEAWDLMIREAFMEIEPDEFEVRDLVYHEYHEANWCQPGVRKTHPVQVYALRRARNHYSARGMPDPYTSL